MKGYRIPFSRPGTVGNELRYVNEAIEAGYLAGDGPFTGKCSKLLEMETSARRALLTTSCTHALEMCGLLLDLQPGDEVVVPSFAFVTTVNAFVLRGVTPVFVDIRPDTLNLDESQLRAKLTDKTRAIVALHYAGVACEMDAIGEIAEEAGVPVVEDNAHGLFGRYRGRHLGALGELATLSFHETKNFTCGEGGALLINDERFIERAEIIREKGTDRARFFRGEVDKYSWVDVGSSYLPSEMLAAFLLAQLEQRDAIQAGRKLVWHRYRDGLADWADRFDVGLPTIPAHCESSHHIFYLLMPSLSARQALIDHLRAQSILAVFHYLPLHLSPMGLRFGGQPGDCPVSERVSDRLVRLPLYHNLSRAEQSAVVEAVLSFRPPG